MNRYWWITRRMGGVALIILLAGLIIGALTGSTYTSVIVQAIPFVGALVALILMFALSIVLTAMRFNGQIPARTHRPIELTLIAGILIGVVLLFQPFHVIGYTYGFPLLLLSTLGFILWSHVIPKSAQRTTGTFSRGQHLIGAAAGVVVALVMFGFFFTTGQPSEPYGMRQRAWDFTDPAEQAEIAAEAQAEFVSVSVPFFVFMSLFPGTLVYFVVREAAAGSAQTPDQPQPNLPSSAATRMRDAA
ncbi:MAG: hypothetical protein GYB67_13375 [Chloroflexi bacterium]|nr:hypothetical protein [Chloroflexota bacterium]